MKSNVEQLLQYTFLDDEDDRPLPLPTAQWCEENLHRSWVQKIIWFFAGLVRHGRKKVHPAVESTPLVGTKVFGDVALCDANNVIAPSTPSTEGHSQLPLLSSPIPDSSDRVETELLPEKTIESNPKTSTW